MDSILGIGLPELIVVLILAGLVMGPHRIRQVARILGRITAQLQGISRQFARQLNAELDALDGGDDIRGAMQDVRSLQREVESLRRELGGMQKSIVNEGKSAVREGEATFKGELPPKAAKALKTEPETQPEPATRPEPAPADTGAAPEEGLAQASRPEKPLEIPVTDEPSLPKAIEVPGDPA